MDIDSENLKIAEAELEWLWKNCRIIYFPPGLYPVEHNPHANKLSRDFIESFMPDFLNENQNKN